MPAYNLQEIVNIFGRILVRAYILKNEYFFNHGLEIPIYNVCQGDNFSNLYQTLVSELKKNHYL